MPHHRLSQGGSHIVRPCLGEEKKVKGFPHTHSKSSPPIYKRRPREGCGPAGSIGVACAAVESTGYRLMATVAAPW